MNKDELRNLLAQYEEVHGEFRETENRMKKELGELEDRADTLRKQITRAVAELAKEYYPWVREGAFAIIDQTRVVRLTGNVAVWTAPQSPDETAIGHVTFIEGVDITKAGKLSIRSRYYRGNWFQLSRARPAGDHPIARRFLRRQALQALNGQSNTTGGYKP